jgi:16S rRNA (guanine966-N2)-methyltransferase
MRIIAGRHRGRKLLPPADDSTRPITDRVKQSLFDILAPHLEGAIVYDCFAGTGSMGLESLSRGAKLAIFFESHRAAVSRLRQNIAALRVENESRVIATDLFKWFAATSPPDVKAGLIFLDPPYRFLRERADELRQLATQMSRHLAADGLMVFRHDAGDALALPNLSVEEVREYGGMAVELLRRES